MFIELGLPMMYAVDIACNYSVTEIPVFQLLTFDKDKCMPYSQPFVNFHTNHYNLRHSVTLIVTLKLQRDNTKIKQRSFKRS